MRITVTLRNGEDELWQREYVEDKMKKLDKYIDTPSEARVVLQVEKFRNLADINLIADGVNINSKEEAKDMRLAIDTAVDKLERQLKKYKEKIRTHKPGGRETGTLVGEPVVEEFDESSMSRVVETKKVHLQPMSLEDAAMQMEETKNLFVVYRDIQTENVHVMYRREGGALAVIETNG
ncbi:MAG: ribosome-associated translation inhibitor RaiA [Syntrophales bacterium]|jgi:putative sigma-54 modulation protein|nr:ribosome-associated translation inhibitor RaiA [Syntrophales bacterium]NLN60904.1 ribosome-associated translation inhibitor RaiA [Deltaproteobacteria bacterium]